jgi:glucose-6-phosphate-specific signal transduction histidine kinase
VEVLSDGDRRELAGSTARPGLGLVGLRERVWRLGGDLEAGPVSLQGKEHFRLAVTLPLQSVGDATGLQEVRS